MRVAFEELLRRFPDLEYTDGGPVIVPSALVRSCVQMNLRFTPERWQPGTKAKTARVRRAVARKARS